jgi:hypothetical protein
MKQKMSISFLFVLFLFVLSACDLVKYEYDFINNSSFILLIQPTNGQDWDTFLLMPLGIKTISIGDDRIYFLYDHAAQVWVDTSVYGTAVFWDR